MQARQEQFNIRAIQSSWQALEAMTHLRPIHDEAGYDEMTALMNSLLDVVGDDEDHLLARLLELVGDLVSAYERRELPIEPLEPRESLRFLIEARKSRLVARVAERIKAKFLTESSGHDWHHINRVWRLARQIAEKEGANQEVVELGALVHDIADWKFHGGDDSIGPREAERLLKELRKRELPKR